MERFKILPGLPVYGESPKQFSATGLGKHREGLVVQFIPSKNKDSWVGNFQRGLNSFDKIFEHPDNTSIVVLAGGECYVIDIESQQLIETFGGAYESIFHIPENNLVILGTSTDFDALDPSGHAWQSQRISWDGLRKLKIENNELTGEAWNLGEWISFSLNIETGKHKGGAKF